MARGQCRQQLSFMAVLIPALNRKQGERMQNKHECDFLKIIVNLSGNASHIVLAFELAGKIKEVIVCLSCLHLLGTKKPWTERSFTSRAASSQPHENDCEVRPRMHVCADVDVYRTENLEVVLRLELKTCCTRKKEWSTWGKKLHNAKLKRNIVIHNHKRAGFPLLTMAHGAPKAHY